MNTEQTYLVTPAEAVGAKTGGKSDAVLKLLSRTRGATMQEMAAATSWQPHSIRAFLSGLRKKGRVLIREERKGGTTAYCIAKAVAVPQRQGA
jgi:hypothetical protein